MIKKLYARKKTLIIIICAIVGVSLITGMLLTWKSNADKLATQQTIDSLMNKYVVTEPELLNMKKDLGSWDKVSSKLYSSKNTLTKHQIETLYDEGYGLRDIEKAMSYAALCDKTSKEVLVLKGKYVKGQKLWDTVVKELGLKINYK